ncbi:HAMP domain-containing protein [Nocardioides albidus]|uniref:histidine kinase n=1 Tax=Nocardioides albidus TaxID=1517589 RepID=A0A5C4WTX2_9ACTN|nr:ATP-binding protein [Nocardioides albidus]TNM50829.1 HAMP domain-containing protein [Nocardioides albidus]
MTTDPPSRSGLSVRTRITAAVALLVTFALAGAGLIVYWVESRALAETLQQEVEQELDEFVALQRTGDFATVRDLLEGFLTRNVPDDDELLVGWIGDGRLVQFPEDPLVDDPRFLEAVAPLVVEGGTTYLDTDRGEVRITAQPVAQGSQRGALLVVTYLSEDRAELGQTMRTYTLVALLSAALVTGAAAWVSGRLLRPLRTLHLAAETITATDLSRRLPERGNDDITALTRTVNGMLDRLEHAFAGQRQFLDDAGHELRTPLTVLRGHLELLDADDPREVAETRALLLDEVDRMGRLVGELIVLAKSDRPDFLSPGPTDPSALLAAVLTKARGLGEREWVLEVAPDLPAELVLDAQRVTQALLALADNAVKHTTPGGRIAVGAAQVGATLRCWVHDDGPGVAAEDRERIFSRFGRAVVPAGDDGFGLGLSIVAAIAQAHGGTAYVESGTARSGARFVLDVPAVLPVVLPLAPPDPPYPSDRSGPSERTQVLSWPTS